MVRPLVIVVDGLIGAGKTTLVNVLAEDLSRCGWRVTKVLEPVKEWQESGILQKYYDDQTRWGYTFQTNAFLTRVGAVKRAFKENSASTDIFILERSVFSDRVFVSMLHKDGKMNDLEKKLYDEWCDMWEQVMPCRPDGFVYLDPGVSECTARLRARDRTEESGVGEDYQARLRAEYNVLFSDDSFEVSAGRHVPVMRVTDTADWRGGEERTKQVLEVEEFLKGVAERRRAIDDTVHT